MKMMMYFVTQLPGVWRTVLQISQKEKKRPKNIQVSFSIL